MADISPTPHRPPPARQKACRASAPKRMQITLQPDLKKSLTHTHPARRVGQLITGSNRGPGPQNSS